MLTCICALLKSYYDHLGDTEVMSFRKSCPLSNVLFQGLIKNVNLWWLVMISWLLVQKKKKTLKSNYEARSGTGDYCRSLKAKSVATEQNLSFWNWNTERLRRFFLLSVQIVFYIRFDGVQYPMVWGFILLFSFTKVGFITWEGWPLKDHLMLSSRSGSVLNQTVFLAAPWFLNDPRVAALPSM